jgi:hypothetical protein
LPEPHWRGIYVRQGTPARRRQLSQTSATWGRGRFMRRPMTALAYRFINYIIYAMTH